MHKDYPKEFRESVKGTSIVFIDAANLERSVQKMFVLEKDIPPNLRHLTPGNLCWAVDYRRLKEFFEANTVECKIRFYSPSFDSESHRKFLYFLDKGLKYKLKTKPLKEYMDHTPETPHRKANFDVEIAVDAVNIIKKYSTLILFSGDCDFEYMIKFLRGKGKIVIGFSRSGHIASELPPVLNRYFDILDFKNEFLNVKAKNPALVSTGSRN